MSKLLVSFTGLVLLIATTVASADCITAQNGKQYCETQQTVAVSQQVVFIQQPACPGQLVQNNYGQLVCIIPVAYAPQPVAVYNQESSCGSGCMLLTGALIGHVLDHYRR